MHLDGLDRRIVHALTIEPRLPFRALGVAIGVSPQTAARRYRDLHDRAGLRITGRVAGPAGGRADWYVRIQCVPGSATELAAALAGRSDTSWVFICSGGTEIVSALQVRTAGERDALLLSGLPASRRVVHLVAHALLHDYSPRIWAMLAEGLSKAEAGLVGHRALAPGPTGETALRGEDDVLVDLLARDGRASSAGLAAAAGCHESTVRRRVLELRRAGVLSFDVDLDPAVLGMRAHALLWASVEPGRLDEVGRAMACHREIPFVAATTGPTNLMASVVCRDMATLHDYLTNRLAGLPGVRMVETSPLLRMVKRTGPA